MCCTGTVRQPGDSCTESVRCTGTVRQPGDSYTESVWIILGAYGDFSFQNDHLKS